MVPLTFFFVPYII